MLENLKQEVLEANKSLQTEGLVTLTWGNVSGKDPLSGLIVIKASGVAYNEMTENDLVVVNEMGEIIEGSRRPSTDLETHLEMYKNFPNIYGIVHTHSTFATVWAQFSEGIPCYGTTHADYFPGVIPVTREMTKEEIQNNYEQNTGKVIVEAFRNKNPQEMRAILVRHHGPFVWGDSALDALHNAIVLENVAKIDLFTKLAGGSNLEEINPSLQKKHYDRKFGKDAYYGQ